MNKYQDLGQKEINAHFIDACSRCDLPLITYFLTSKELKKKANIVRGCDGDYEAYSYDNAMRIRAIVDLSNKMNTDLIDKPETKKKI